MDPITYAIDKVEDLIGHSPHPAIVAVPLGAWTVSNVCDGLAMATGDEAFDDAARISLAVGLVGATGAVLTGLRDYSHIPRDRESHAVATSHGLFNALASSLMVGSLVLRLREHDKGRKAGVSARLLGLAGGGISLYSAWLGGRLVEEMGEGVKPVQDRHPAGGIEDEGDEHGRARLDPEAPLGVHHA